jgi:hypothetical protein
MWSDGGPWTRNMSIHDVAYLQIQYIEVVYNTSGPYNESSSTTTVRPRNAEQTSTYGSDRKCGRNAEKSHGDKEAEVRERDALSMLRGDYSTGGCKVVCSIDDRLDTSSIGTPMVLYNSTSSDSLTKRSGTWHAMVSPMVVGALVGISLYF